jgi:hypothetical protein
MRLARRSVECWLCDGSPIPQARDQGHPRSPQLGDGLLQRAEDPGQSGARDCTGRLGGEVSGNRILAVDRLRLLVNEGAGI